MQTFTLISAILILLYLTLFKVYKTERHPYFRNKVYNLRLYIASKLIYLVIDIMPNGKEKTQFATVLLDCANQNTSIKSI